MCIFCEQDHNDFVRLNDTDVISGIEISLNRQGMLRVRFYNNDGWNFVSQDILNIGFCPMCGRNLKGGT